VTRRLLAIALLGLVPLHASAHRLDEYLQATILSIEPHSVQATMRLVPGVSVAPAIIATIDSNHDGVISSEEQHHYAESVLADLQLQEDSSRLPLHLLSATYPSLEQMKQGRGEIELTFSAELSTGPANHQLTYLNHHQAAISVYLVNSLVPKDKTLSIAAQTRNQNQSVYQVTLTQANNTVTQHLPFNEFSSGFSSAFQLGAHHIAEGTDHLLFLLTLLLPAPLLAFAGRWSGRAPLRHSLTHILGIVTAFTLGHSLTLALSSLGFVHLPSQPVEVLIAVSILVSAIHAIRPLFPGREAIIAAFFGLIHGLAFASALNELGITGWYRLSSLLAFNLGLEAMQLAVVAATLPALLILSRTDRYTLFRITAAVLACIASCAWIIERTLNQPNPIGDSIQKLAHHGLWICALLWACCALVWFHQRYRPLLNTETAATRASAHR
jgi:hypothetical protein